MNMENCELELKNEQKMLLQATSFRSEPVMLTWCYRELALEL